MLAFKHSGQLGDIIYSLPAMIALSETKGVGNFVLYIPSDKRANHAPGINHVGGNLMVSESMYEFIEPLLTWQPYVSSVFYVPEKCIPSSAIDFDAIRSGQINLSAGNIKDYYFKAFGLVSRSAHQWLRRSFSATNGCFDVIIGRSTRYINDSVDYGVLADCDLNIGFVGIDSEFLNFSKRYPNLTIEHARASNALEVCDLISSSRLYIGNQSFFFSIAEALQADRVLEVFEPVPNVVPSGGRYAGFVSTQGLVSILVSFLGERSGFRHAVNEDPRYILSL